MLIKSVNSHQAANIEVRNFRSVTVAYNHFVIKWAMLILLFIFIVSPSLHGLGRASEIKKGQILGSLDMYKY